MSDDGRGDFKIDLLGEGSQAEGTGAARKAASKAPLARGSACIICRKRKLRCDGARPQCATCKRLSHDCQYGDPMHEKLVERNRELELRINQLEEEVASYRDGGRQGDASLLAFPSISIPHSATPSTSSLRSHDLPFGFGDALNVPATSARTINVQAGATSYPPNVGSQDNSFLISSGPQNNLPSTLPFPPNIPSYPDHSNSPNVLYAESDARRLQFHSPLPSESPLSPPPPVSGPSYSNDPNQLSSWSWPQPIDARLPPLESPQQSMIYTWAGDLPPLDLVIDLANLYFVTIHNHLPFLHRPRFLYTLHHPTAIASAPSLCLTFAVLAIAAPYHDDADVRARGSWWYQRAKDKAEEVVSAGTNDRGGAKANLTVEIIQALCLLEMIEMGRTEHQRASLTICQAARLACMLGLHRLDEDRIAKRLAQTSDRKLRPPAVHPLPTDPLLLEECRRTMCALFVLDRFESGCTGWPCAVAEPDLRLLAPCADELFEAGTCETTDNPLFWPTSTLEADDRRSPAGPKIGAFAWLCRVALLGARIQGETYRALGAFAGGPFRTYDLQSPFENDEKVLALDKDMNYIREKLNALAMSSTGRGVNQAAVMTLIVLNGLFVNLHHLRAARVRVIPYNPTLPTVPGSAEYSMSRCLDGIYSLHEIISQVLAYENARTSIYLSRITTFTSFIPYILYCIAFPCKFAIGDWDTTGEDRSRTEKFRGGIVPGETAPPVPSGDDVFGVLMDESRLTVIASMCQALEQVGTVWPTGTRFAKMLGLDRARFAERVSNRLRFTPSPVPLSSNPHSSR